MDLKFKRKACLALALNGTEIFTQYTPIVEIAHGVMAVACLKCLSYRRDAWLQLDPFKSSTGTVVNFRPYPPPPRVPPRVTPWLQVSRRQKMWCPVCLGEVRKKQEDDRAYWRSIHKLATFTISQFKP